MGGFYLIIKDINVIIISSELDIEKKLSSYFGKVDKLKIFTVNRISAMADVEELNPNIIILDEASLDIQKKRLSFIRDYKNYENLEVIVVSGKENFPLKEFLAEGIQEFIFLPYTKEEIYLRVKSLIHKINLKKQCEEKVIQMKALMNNIPYMTWIKDKENRYIYVNNKFKEVVGKEEKSICGSKDKTLWDSNIMKISTAQDALVMNKKKQDILDITIEREDGDKRFSIYKSPIIGEGDSVKGTIGIAADFTEFKQMEAELDIILENIPFGVCIKDVRGKIIDVNTQFLKYYGVTREEILNTDGSEVLNKECYELLKKEDEKILCHREGKTFERRVKLKDRHRIMEVHKEPIQDKHNTVIGILVLIKDVTDVKEYQENIEKLAYRDQLTGLDNRRSLYEYINSQLQNKGKLLTILFVDLDNFKKLNDSLGHWYGDEALIEIAERLKEACEEGFVARTGGDEFAVVFEDLFSEEVLIKKLEGVLKATNTEFIHEDKINIISGSIGVIKSYTHNEDIETLFTKGFLALYKAKEQGKNKYVMYTDDLEEQRKFDVEIEMALRECINNNEVKVYYQPQYGKNEVTGGKVLIGFEALFRWENEKYKHMPTIDIIRTIEKLKIMGAIDEFVMKEAFTFAKRINAGREKKLVVSTNISALEIMEDNFVEKVKRVLEEVGVAPELVGIEITETVLIENIDNNILKIKALKDLGMKVALDDFGTGYSSLSYLVKLPLSHVKIDKSFVSNMSNGLEYIKLTGLIIEVTHSLGLKVIAEGVETYRELEILDDMGIDYIQGYYFSKPLSGEKAEILACESV